MPAYEVSRTLVKSPPEVWSELEQAERLAELLGDDAIKITRRDPETRIEWTGAAASGTIEIGASGWGTKVRLTAKIAEPAAETKRAAEPADAEPDSTATESAVDAPEELAVEPAAVVQDSAAQTSTEPTAEAEVADVELAEADEAETEVAEAEVAEKVSLWRRIRNAFSTQPAVTAGEIGSPASEGRETADSADSNSENPDSDNAAKSEPRAARDHESIASEPVEPIVEDPPPAEQIDQAAAFKSAEADEAEADIGGPSDSPTASGPQNPTTPEADFESLLTSVLDHLGSAHKRPFSAV